MPKIQFIAAFALYCCVAAAQSPFSCSRVDTPGVVRAEGLTELLPDIVIECTGGRAGTAAPPIYTFLVAVVGTWAIRPAFTAPTSASSTVGPSPTPPWNEALLLIDDPGPEVQIICLPATSFAACAPHAGANIFPTRILSDNLVAFTEIPLIPPGEGNIRRIRIANLRVNVPLTIARTEAIETSIQMFDYLGNLVPLGPRQAISAEARPAFAFRLLDANGTAVDATVPALLASPSVVPLNTPVADVSFLAVFEEGFVSAFRRRNVASTPLDPANVQSQNVAGLPYNTEAGFFDIRLPLTTALSLSGSADSGTRLRLNIDDIPKNVLVWVSIRDTQLGTLGYDESNPKALLTYTNPNGDGPFSPVSPYIPGWAQLYGDNGKALAVWEVVSSDPAAIDQIAFSVALTSQGTAGMGAATVRGSIAPFIESASLDGTTVVDTLTVVPRFQVPALSVAAFTLTNSLKTSPVSFTSGANLSGTSIAPGSFATALSTGLAADTFSAAYPWPTTLGGLQVQLIDSTGVSRLAQLLVVSPLQVNFLVPDNTRTGVVLINLIRQGIVVATGVVNVRSVAPGLFSVDGTGNGIAAGTVLYLTSSGSNPPQPLAVQDETTGVWRPVPIALLPDQLVYLSIDATGIRNRSSLTALAATIGGEPVPVLYAGAQSETGGFDQINLGPLPPVLRGRGDVELVITVDGQEANRVRITLE